MKLMFTLALMTLASSPASSANLSKANLYTCKGRDSEVSLATSSLTGKPRLGLMGSQFTGQTLTATELAETKMGYEASVSVANLSDISIDYTFIVPAVMSKRGESFQVKALLIKTTGGGLVSPELVPGPVQKNTPTEFICRATLVDF